MNRKNKVLLYLGGFLFISIGGYHIFLPFVWGWDAFSNAMPDMIEWALYATNFLMSSIMVLLGLFTFIAVKKNRYHEGKFIFFVCGFFWVLNIGYQVVNPTPIPPEFYQMKIGFLIPPVIGTCCYFIPIIEIGGTEQ